MLAVTYINKLGGNTPPTYYVHSIFCHGMVLITHHCSYLSTCPLLLSECKLCVNRKNTQLVFIIPATGTSAGMSSSLPRIKWMNGVLLSWKLEWWRVEGLSFCIQPQVLNWKMGSLRSLLAPRVYDSCIPSTQVLPGRHSYKHHKI